MPMKEKLQWDVIGDVPMDVLILAPVVWDHVRGHVKFPVKEHVVVDVIPHVMEHVLLVVLKTRMLNPFADSEEYEHLLVQDIIRTS